MKLAIIDGMHQDIGLKLLFPEADYYIHTQDNTKKHNIQLNRNWSNITDQNYDFLFIVISLYDAKPGTKFFKQDVHAILQKELEIINSNNFKKVFIFDNYDYDYDPTEILNNNKKIHLFFKRNYNQTKKYKENVVPFPFIMFGDVSIVEKIENTINYEVSSKLPRIFFTGNLFEHNDPEINYYRNRRNLYNKISRYIFNPGSLEYNTFLQEIRASMFALDLNGVGDPNKRTFEILSQRTLMISEFNNLKWPFAEKFSEETVFKDENDFVEKIQRLVSDKNLYKKCLDNQNSIYNKYFNKEWIRNYIIGYL
jgi:hypothetical protein